MSLEGAAPPLDRRWFFVCELVLVVAATLFAFATPLLRMAREWAGPEFSQGYVVPLIALLMAVRQWGHIDKKRIDGSWAGFVVVISGVVILGVGALSTSTTLGEYAFLIVLIGIILAALGGYGARTMAPAWLYLFLMVPMSHFYLVQITPALQLLSTGIGGGLLHVTSTPALIEGNIVDLGNYKLQVAEACSGLRYIFPLLSFGFLFVYLYRAPIWQRIIVIASIVPICIVLNGLRIAFIGLSVDRFGIDAAKGFVHLTEGWAVFLVCVLLVFVESELLLRLSNSTGTVQDRLDFSIPRLRDLRLPKGPQFERWVSPLTASLLVIILTSLSAPLVSYRSEVIPDREPLALFPTQLEGWHATRLPLPTSVLKHLKLSDYLNADFTRRYGDDPINLYIAYYASQKANAAIHSPHDCLPGGGWQVLEDRVIFIRRVGRAGRPFRVRRVLIRKGFSRDLVYYWFQERGRIIVNAYHAKWFMFLDSIFRHRTDGALIRLATPITANQNRADTRLRAFAASLESRLSAYVPN